MTDRPDSTTPDPGVGPVTPPPGPDPARPAAPRTLDRVPGERYRAPAAGASAGRGPGGGSGSTGGGLPGAPGTTGSPSGTRARAIVAGGCAAGAGALAYAALGQIDLGLGLLAVAAFVGWVVALALVWGAGAASPIPRQAIIAGLLGGGAIVVGLLLAWAWSRVEGGVLGPLDYTDQRYGPVAYLEVLVAGVVAGLRAR
jgi:hypothetical protein